MDWLRLNGGDGENLFSLADFDPRVPGYVAATTSDTQLMYDLPFGLHPTYYPGSGEPAFDSQWQAGASGQ